jgi:cytoplasmic tRNA 2-thiolation protein 2
MAEPCEEELKIPEKKKGCLLGRSCMRCSGTPKIVVRLLDPLCRSCFEEYFIHKFRSVLGKSRAIQYGEKVLIAVSGGASSTAMLHLIRAGLSPTARRKLQLKPLLVFIDETSAGDTEDVQTIKRILKSMELQCRFASLEDLFRNKTSREASPVDQLRTLFSSLATLTAKEDILQSLRSHLLATIARQLECTKVMVGDNSTRLAVRLFSNVAQGRGGVVPLNTGMCDTRYGDVTFIRPMREFSAKEIAYYNYCNDIITVSLPSLSFGSPLNGSIDRLTEQFVVGLQSDFPSTVSTIFRTGNKLALSQQEKTTEQCVLCQSPRLSAPNSSSALSDLQQSFKPVNSALDKETAKCLIQTDSCSNSSCACSDSQVPPHSLLLSMLKHHICYGCERTIKGCKAEAISMPSDIILECQKRERRMKMKDTIQDFLLDDPLS